MSTKHHQHHPMNNMNYARKGKSKKNNLSDFLNIIAYLLGGFLIVGCLSFISTSIITSLSFLIAGLICLPIVHKLINQATKMNISGFVFIPIVIVLLIVGSAFNTRTNSDDSKSASNSSSSVDTEKQKQESDKKAEEERLAQEKKAKEEEEKIAKEIGNKLNTAYDKRFEKFVDSNRKNVKIGYLYSTKTAYIEENVTTVKATVPEAVTLGISKFVASCTEFFKLEEVNECMLSYDLDLPDSKGNMGTVTPVALLVERKKWEEFKWDNLKFKPIHDTLIKEKILVIDPKWDKQVKRDGVSNAYIPSP